MHLTITLADKESGYDNLQPLEGFAQTLVGAINTEKTKESL